MKRRTSERGSTLIEMMVTVAVMFLIIGGTILFMISQAKMSSSAMDLNDVQRGGRLAMSLLADKLGVTGLGLPRGLAIKSFVTNEACGAVQTPKLEVAALEYRRQWKLLGTAVGTLNFFSADPSPGGAAADVQIPPGRWLYLFTGAGVGAHGMVRAGAARDIGGVSLTVDSTNYSLAQTSLDLAPTAPLNNTGGHDLVMLQASIAGFGVDCTNVEHPYLYWEDNGVRTPVVSNLDIRPLAGAVPAIGAAAGDVVALRFRFILDQDGDGQADATVAPSGCLATCAGTACATCLSIDADAAVATHDDVIAIEVQLRVRGERPEQQLGNQYRFQDFVEVIRTDNINTRAGQYVFIDNLGL